MLLGDITAVVEPLAIGHPRALPRRAQVRESDPTVDVLAEVHHPPPGTEPSDRGWSEFFDPPDRWRQRRHEPVEAMLLDAYRAPGRPVLPVASTPEVVYFTGDEIGSQDVALDRAPCLVGPENHRATIDEHDFELHEKCGGRSVVVDSPSDTVLPSPPPVAQQCTDDVVAYDEQSGHIERVDL